MFQTEKRFYVYILASSKSGSLYTGVTNNIIRRVTEHKNNVNPNSHTAKYNIKRLVYFEEFDDPKSAITREKFIKLQKRAYRVKLIEKDNPNWSELFYRIQQ